MAWAARGKTIEVTAEILGISAETVETHIKNALRKLNVANKTQGAAKCVALGMVDL
jgi:DNA-binding CsgD family transcriptional regulator